MMPNTPIVSPAYAFLTHLEQYYSVPEGMTSILAALQQRSIVLDADHRTLFPTALLKGLCKHKGPSPIFMPTYYGQGCREHPAKDETRFMEICDALLAQGAQWWVTPFHHDRNPFLYALYLGMPELARTILHAPQAPSVQQLEGATHSSLRNGLPLHLLLKYWQAHLEGDDKTVTQGSVYQKALQAFCTQEGFDVNLHDPETGNTLLHEARAPIVVSTLLDLGARTDLKNKQEEDPPSTWRRCLAQGEAEKMLSEWNKVTKKDRLALPVEERVAEAFATVETSLTTKGRLESHLRQWGLKGHELDTQGRGWNEFGIAFFSQNWLQALELDHLHTACAESKTFTPQHMGGWHALSPLTALVLHCVDKREHFYARNEKVVGDAVWPLLFKRCFQQDSPSFPLLMHTCFLKTRKKEKEVCLTALNAHVAPEALMPQARLEEILHAVPHMWRDAPLLLSSPYNALKQALEQFRATQQERRDLSHHDTVEEVAHNILGHYWMQGLSFYLFGIPDRDRVPALPSVYKAWIDTTQSWEPNVAQRFWHTLGGSLMQTLGTQSHQKSRHWLRALKGLSVPPTPQTWAMLVPLTQALTVRLHEGLTKNHFENVTKKFLSFLDTLSWNNVPSHLPEHLDTHAYKEEGEVLMELFQHMQQLLEQGVGPDQATLTALQPLLQSESALSFLKAPLEAFILHAQMPTSSTTSFIPKRHRL